MVFRRGLRWRRKHGFLVTTVFVPVAVTGIRVEMTKDVDAKHFQHNGEICCSTDQVECIACEYGMSVKDFCFEFKSHGGCVNVLNAGNNAPPPEGRSQAQPEGQPQGQPQGSQQGNGPVDRRDTSNMQSGRLDRNQESAQINAPNPVARSNNVDNNGISTWDMDRRGPNNMQTGRLDRNQDRRGPSNMQTGWQDRNQGSAQINAPNLIARSNTVDNTGISTRDMERRDPSNMQTRRLDEDLDSVRSNRRIQGGSYTNVDNDGISTWNTEHEDPSSLQTERLDEPLDSTQGDPDSINNDDHEAPARVAANRDGSDDAWEGEVEEGSQSRHAYSFRPSVMQDEWERASDPNDDVIKNEDEDALMSPHRRY
eukprot:TRINITY_DN1697_c0_g1_i1.p1 TRINITY_DN1697_c0_g1~~TRINITY_DN1697_c0_g1_i1.p1  ORF type:complete len:368 (+),score=51.06 TRINITY_DN1697_c0_g1_i1:118-1221(+)